MNLEDCYRLLGLQSGASFEEIKVSYRRLVRRYHPDVNPGNQQAKEKFIAITEAYKFLLANKGSALGPGKRVVGTSKSGLEAANAAPPNPNIGQPVSVRLKAKPSPIQFNPELSPLEQQLKASSYQQLQQFLKENRFPRAIALVEGLARRIPQDPEVTQWQAISYQRWGRYLIQQRQVDKARSYLKKALRTDPHNRSLWAEVEKDFRELERLF